MCSNDDNDWRALRDLRGFPLLRLVSIVHCSMICGLLRISTPRLVFSNFKEWTGQSLSSLLHITDAEADGQPSRQRRLVGVRYTQPRFSVSLNLVRSLLIFVLIDSTNENLRWQ